MSEIYFCLNCHKVVEVKDIAGKMYSFLRGQVVFVPSQGYEIGFHDSEECCGLVIEIDPNLVDKMQCALENAGSETDLHPLVEERCRESLNNQERKETNDTTAIN